MLSQTLRRLCALDWSERGALLGAACWLGVARLAVLAVPFKHIAPLLGDPGAASTMDMPPTQLAQARQVGWAVRAVARRTPWDSNCLAQALAARGMLRRRGIPNTLYLGVKKNDGDPREIDAHAWLRCGNEILTGKRRQADFTVISTFSEK